MPWILPPEEVRRRVNSAFGTDMFQRLSQVWDAAQSDLPSPVPAYAKTQQTRFKPPERVTGAEGPVSPTSGHYLGLNFDVDWSNWTPEAKARLAQILSVTRIQTVNGAVPVVVENAYGKVWHEGQPLPALHLHWGIGSDSIKRAGLAPVIAQIVAGLRTQVAGR